MLKNGDQKLINDEEISSSLINRMFRNIGSLLRLMLIILGCLLALGMVLQAIFHMPSNQYAEIISNDAAKAEEKIFIQQYFQETGIRVGSRAEAELYDADNRRKEFERRIIQMVTMEIFDIPEKWINHRELLTHEERELANGLLITGERQNEMLLSMINEIKQKPEAFPPEVIKKVLDNLLKLTINLRTLSNIGRMGVADVSGWNSLNNLEPSSILDSAVTNLAKLAANKSGCELFNLIGTNATPIFWYEYSLAKIESEKQSCAGVRHLLNDNNWQQQIERVNRLKKYIGNEKYAHIHVELIHGFAKDCEQPIPSPLAQALGACAWQTKTMKSDAIEANLKSEVRKFKFFPIEVKEAISQAQTEQLIGNIISSKVGGAVAGTLAELKQYGQISIAYPVGYWINNESTKLVIHLSNWPDQNKSVHSPSNYPGYLEHSRSFLLVVTKSDSQYIVGPGQHGQYDDGQIVSISDKDQDGNIEVWITAEWGECDCEDCKPGVDCAISNYYMEEQFGSELGGYIQGVHP